MLARKSRHILQVKNGVFFSRLIAVPGFPGASYKVTTLLWCRPQLAQKRESDPFPDGHIDLRGGRNGSTPGYWIGRRDWFVAVHPDPQIRVVGKETNPGQVFAFLVNIDAKLPDIFPDRSERIL